jgi:PHD/YefM family antitoxin component YafN of YafNO toxin-antitoxin module
MYVEVEMTTFSASQDRLDIEETLYLLSIPDMKESIKEGLNTPIEETDQKLDW